jgi:hypothetical protein
MTDTPISEIKKALENATPGPWLSGKTVYAEQNNIDVCAFYFDDWCGDSEDFENAEANAHLIANAPVWLAELIKANETAAAKERERIISILEGMREKAAPKLLGSDTHWRTKERIDALSKAIEAIRDE